MPRIPPLNFYTFLPVLLAGIALMVPGCKSLTVEEEAVHLNQRDCSGQAFHLDGLCDDEIDLLKSALADPAVRSPAGVDRDHLRELAAERGLDYATAVFFQHVSATAPTRLYLDRVAGIRKRLQKQPGQKPLGRDDITLAMIPAMYYDSNASVGGDGRDIRNMATRLGIPNELVIVDPDGHVNANGEFLCEWLADRPQRKFLFASISKAALDIKRAIQLCGSAPDGGAFRNVIGWLNIGGTNRGSYLINEMDSYWAYRWRAQYFFWRQGYTYDSFLSVKVDENAPYHAHVKLPPKMKVVNVIATPIRQHLTARSAEAYDILSKHGPNDGLTILADSFMPGAINISLWGNDHYFAFPAKREILLRTAMTEFIENAPR
ncbi:MAG: hypothetical protein RIF32_17460 [Leptospirales bacterium]|jgi:hypothetical protein